MIRWPEILFKKLSRKQSRYNQKLPKRHKIKRMDKSSQIKKLRKQRKALLTKNDAL